jgi:flagellar biosynthesis chaperone FliJ
MPQIDELQCANEALTATAKQTQFQVESLQAACKKLTADRDEYRQEAKSASQRLSELADELDAAQRKAEKMEQVRVVCLIGLTNSNDFITSLSRQDGGASDSKINALTKRVEELRSALTEKSVDLKATSEGNCLTIDCGLSSVFSIMSFQLLNVSAVWQMRYLPISRKHALKLKRSSSKARPPSKSFAPNWIRCEQKSRNWRVKANRNRSIG